MELKGFATFLWLGESVLSVLSATSVDIWHYNHNISQDNFIRCQFTAMSHRVHNSRSWLFYHYCLLQKQSFHSRLSHSTISITLQRNGTVLRNVHELQDHFWSFLSYWIFGQILSIKIWPSFCVVSSDSTVTFSLTIPYHVIYECSPTKNERASDCIKWKENPLNLQLFILNSKNIVV